MTNPTLPPVARYEALRVNRRGADVDTVYFTAVDATAYDRLAAECERLRALLNTPEIADFVKAVQNEAAHQRERWPSEHDTGKTDADWFWLIGYLAGKAMHNLATGNTDKGLHHIITTAAACANWHHQRTVGNNMRPGIEPPEALTPTSKEPQQ
jgi:hypothetical protein